MKYTVSVAVEGRIDINVTAGNFEEAKEKAMEEFMSADLKNMEIVDSHAVNAEDENRKFVDY